MKTRRRTQRKTRVWENGRRQETGQGTWKKRAIIRFERIIKKLEKKSLSVCLEDWKNFATEEKEKESYHHVGRNERLLRNRTRNMVKKKKEEERKNT